MEWKNTPTKLQVHEPLNFDWKLLSTKQTYVCLKMSTSNAFFSFLEISVSISGLSKPPSLSKSTVKSKSIIHHLPVHQTTTYDCCTHEWLRNRAQRSPSTASLLQSTHPQKSLSSIPIIHSSIRATTTTFRNNCHSFNRDNNGYNQYHCGSSSIGGTSSITDGATMYQSRSFFVLLGSC